MGDLFLGPPDLTKSEEIFLANALRKFANGVGKIAREKRVKVHQGINTEAIDIVFRDQVIESRTNSKHNHPLGFLVMEPPRPLDEKISPWGII